LQQPEPGRITFDVFMAFNAHLEYEQQNWRNGARMWSGSIRARFRAKAAMSCEATIRTEPGALLLPDAIVRFHVVQARVGYEQFVTEHINGVGGEMAELIGDAAHSSLNRFHPDLERNLLAKANAAIEKSADTKEVHVGLSDVLKKKGWWPKSPTVPVSQPIQPTGATVPTTPPEPQPIPQGP
jgi:hypothetical protein